MSIDDDCPGVDAGTCSGGPAHHPDCEREAMSDGTIIGWLAMIHETDGESDWWREISGTLQPTMLDADKERFAWLTEHEHLHLDHHATVSAIVAAQCLANTVEEALS